MSPELSCNQPRRGRKSWLFCFAWSSWCLVSVVLLFLTMPQICLQFVIVVFPDHTDSLFFMPWTAVWSAEHKIFINIAITRTMLSLNETCIHIHVIDR